ncbi:MAG: NADPH:quinone reductase [Chloroflexota bacterium]|jgi:NADPH2:quinone reductase|nr:NADPH:quinone reductase [Chloroflexota bacterium]
MQAVHVIELSGPDGLRLVQIPEPARGSGVLIEVHAVGVRYADLLQTRGMYQERAEPPYVPFREMAGVVVDASDGSRFQVGDRVAGTAAQAGAELARASEDELYMLPASLSYEQGAGLALNYETAIFGLEVRGRAQAGEAVLVHGAAGGTGTAAIQVAKALGCRSIAVVSSDDKERIARAAGADEVVRSDGPWKDEAVALTGGRGVDMVWDPVGGDRTLDTMRALAPGGRWIVIGFVGGPIPQVPLNRVMLKNIDVVGASFGGYVGADPAAAARLRERLTELLASGHIQPIVEATFPLAEAAGALRMMDERRATGKVVITVR